jgi:3-oxoacyl-[acyl-carrier protein] reductase
VSPSSLPVPAAQRRGEQADDELSLRGHTALVTGSGRNIGRAIALELAGRGANVVVNARSDVDAARAVAAEIEQRGVSAMTFVGDVSDAEVLADLHSRATATFGTVDIAISNANPRLYKSLDETTLEDWNHHLNVQLTTSFMLAKLFAPAMKDLGWGRFIHINGPDGWYGGPRRLPAASGKAGLRNLTKSLAAELGKYGITVNDVVPGPVDSVRDPVTHPNLGAAALARIATEIPIGRLIDSREVAWACLWLCSRRSGGMNGIALHVDGGWKMLG